MALQHYTMALNSAPVCIVQAPNADDLTRVYITNLDATNHFYLGGPTVSSTNGYEVTNQQATGVSYRAEFSLSGGEALYAVCAPTKTATIAIIVSGA
jgi:hypothetical protein